MIFYIHSAIHCCFVYYNMCAHHLKAQQAIIVKLTLFVCLLSLLSTTLNDCYAGVSVDIDLSINIHRERLLGAFTVNDFKHFIQPGHTGENSVGGMYIADSETECS